MVWNKICCIFELINFLKMARNSKNIYVRTFSGSSVSVGSPFGKILINSKDSKAVASAVRAVVRGEVQVVKLSKETIASIKLAKAE